MSDIGLEFLGLAIPELEDHFFYLIAHKGFENSVFTTAIFYDFFSWPEWKNMLGDNI